MPSGKTRSDRTWFMYQNLHDDVSRLLEEDDLHFDFYKHDYTKTCIKEYDTNIMGRFICRNHACNSNGWSSMRIAITIRMYPGAQYNARVYNQRCQRCNRLGEPRLDSSYRGLPSQKVVWDRDGSAKSLRSKQRSSSKRSV